MATELFPNLDPPADIDPNRRPLTPEQADKLPHIHRLLLGYYGQPKPREPWDPLTPAPTTGSPFATPPSPTSNAPSPSSPSPN
jgi:hypothetical protein